MTILITVGSNIKLTKANMLVIVEEITATKEPVLSFHKIIMKKEIAPANITMNDIITFESILIP